MWIRIPQNLGLGNMQVNPTPLTQRTQILPSLIVMEEILEILTPRKTNTLCKNTNPQSRSDFRQSKMTTEVTLLKSHSSIFLSDATKDHSYP